MSTDWCRGFGAAPRECRYFSLSPVFVGLKCARASRGFCLPFGVYFFLGCFHWLFAWLLFCFLDKAGVFVGSSIVVPPVFPFFSLCLPCPLFVCFCFLFSPSFSTFFFFCIYYEFILAEDVCVHFLLLLISFSFSGGFFVKEGFPLF